MDDSQRSDSDEDRQVERDIREHQEFSLSGAIGRLGGADLLKGASPVTRKEQAKFLIEQALEKYLRDSDGAMEVVLLRTVVASRALLDSGYDQPLVTLRDFCRSLVDAPNRLSEFVRQVDMEWGRMYEERPHFELPGRAPSPDDPYTIDSVKQRLQELLVAIPDEPQG